MKRSSTKSLPAAFLSYTHFDDELSNRKLTEFGKRLSDEVRGQTGDEFIIFQDKRHLEWGENWRTRIDEAIGGATFLIPVLTPSFFKSEACRDEVLRFLGRKEKRKRDDLVLLPLYFIDEPLINDKNLRANDLLAEAIASHQYADWRDLRFEPSDSAATGKAFETLAIQIVKASIKICNTLQSTNPQSVDRRRASIRPLGVSIVSLPLTGPKLYGRDAELRILDEAWANIKTNRKTNVISIVAWGGVGKSALVNWWLNRMGEEDYRGAEKVFGWSFYTQGTRVEDSSADLFLAKALKWFGDRNPNKGGPGEKGARLADLIRRQRTLLILDGLEPLQEPLGEKGGRLKHPGVGTLLSELGRYNPGLCVVSSRLALTDLIAMVGMSVRELKLGKLSPVAGRQLLKSQGANGPGKEMEKASAEFLGHALALSILGDFIKKAWGGDIRRRDRIGPLIHEPERGGHARRVIETYARWLRDDPKRQVEFEALQMMGLFDRPIELGVWKILVATPAIKLLTDHISRANETRWRSALETLREAELLSNVDLDHPDALDCHPLIREYFSEELQKENPKAWKQAHERLFSFFYRKTKKRPRTVEEMAPYYQAITHACLAGRYRDAFFQVYMPYIRQDHAYNTNTLRAFADDLAALNRFLQKTQREVVSELEDHSSFILGERGFDLRALGRLDEAVESMNAALSWDKAQGRNDYWHRINASRQADILSTTYLIGGNVRDALRLAEEAVDLAKDDEYHKMICLTTRADAKHRAGDLNGAKKDFWEAELINKRVFSKKKWRCLRSFQGFRYCDYFLTVGSFNEVYQRVKNTLVWDEHGGYPTPTPPKSIILHILQTEGSVLPLALDHLMFARALVEDGENKQQLREAKAHLEKALNGIQASATRHLWPRALLVKAQWLRAHGEAKEAEGTLKECLSICERDKMRLYEADCHYDLSRLYLEEAASGRGMNALKRALDELTRAKIMSNALGYGLLKRRIVRIAGDVP